eukprot:scaffold220887_cov43-Attheya_sp.AAC.1
MGDIPIKLQKSSTATKDEDDDKVLTQRLEQLYDDGKRKNEVPLFYGGDAAEAMIRTVREFDEATDDLEFTEANEKFTNFRKCLRDVARDDWDTAKVGQDMTIAAQITDYLASEQVIADTRRDKNPRGRGSTGRNNHNGPRGYNPGRGRGYQGRSYQGRGRSSSNKRSSSWTPSNNSHNEAKNDPCRYHGNAHTWLKCYGNPDGPNYRPGFTPRAHGATGRGRGGYHDGRGNGGDRNDAYQNEAATNANSNNNNAPSAASTLPTIIGLIPSVRLNDARTNHSSLSRQTEDLILPFWRTEEKVDDNFAP